MMAEGTERAPDRRRRRPKSEHGHTTPFLEPRRGLVRMDVTINGTRRSLYGRSKEEVREKADALREDARLGVVIGKREPTVAEWMEEWLSTYCAGKETGTQRFYHQKAKYVVEELGSVKLRALTTRQVNVMLAGLVGRLNITSLQHVRVTLSTALERALENDLVARNVARKATKYKREERKPQVLTPEQGERLATICADDPLGGVVLLGALTGMRPGEILGLTWGCVDFERREIRVAAALKRKVWNKSTLELGTPKTEESQRTIHGIDHPLLWGVLKRHQARQYETRLKAREWEDNDLVFPNGIGRILNPSNYRSRYYAFKSDREAPVPDLFSRAGIPFYIPPHRLRHCFGTWLMKLDVSPKVVQEIMGHKHVSTTLRFYQHTDEDQQKQAMSRLSGLLRTQPVPHSVPLSVPLSVDPTRTGRRRSGTVRDDLEGESYSKAT
jgi:integrase